MESAAVLQYSFHNSMGTVSHTRSLMERPVMVPVSNVSWSASRKLGIQGSSVLKLASFPMKQKTTLVSYVKASETVAASKVDADSSPQGTPAKSALRSATFPNGFEALVLDVCDETEIAELKIKVGDFQMHLKRNVGATKASSSIISPTSPPPIPSEPMNKSVPSTPPPPPPKIPEKSSPFINVSQKKSSKLEALEASGATGYLLVSSPTVGSFRRGRTLKGKKQPPICKEGDVIKEGQTIGIVDQFGTELPVKSDKAGEVLRVLINEGEAVGYGDPLIAVLPSFHGIK